MSARRSLVGELGPLSHSGGMGLCWVLLALVAVLAVAGAGFVALWLVDVRHHRAGASRWLRDGLQLWFAGAVLAVLAAWLHVHP